MKGKYTRRCFSSNRGSFLKGGEAEEDDEAKSNARVSQERQRTLDRLRSLKLVRSCVLL